MKNLSIPTMVLIAAFLLVSTVIRGCGSKDGVEGTYSGMRGTEIIELRSGGKAVYTHKGLSSSLPCTYNVDGNKLTLDCNPKGLKRGFIIHDDGSLSDEVTIGEGRFTGGKWRKIK